MTTTRTNALPASTPTATRAVTPGTSAAAVTARKPVTVRRAVDADADALVDILVRSFDQDPVANWFVRQDEHRAAGFDAFFGMAVRSLTLPHGEVYTTTDLAGVALWVPPGAWQMGWLRQMQLLPEATRAFGPTGLVRGLRSFAALDARHPRWPHQYGMFIGVDPDAQGRGIGSALMRTVADRCDALGIGAYLEGTSPDNVRLYERFGFRIVEQFALPGGGPISTLMWRMPAER